MLRYTAIRIGQAIPVLILVACGNFLLLQASPGDAAELIGGSDASPATIRAIRHKLGLDHSVFDQLLRWLGNAARGNLGTSYTSKQSVSSILEQRIGPTFQLAVGALIVIVGVGVPLGVVAALRKDGWLDRSIRVLSLGAAAIPGLVLGVLLVLIFGWWFPGILPFQGYVSFTSDPVSGLQHTLLPAIALAAAPIGIIVRLTRASMIEVLDQEYVLAARAGGVGPWELVWRDAMKNGLLSVLTVLGVVVGYLLSGAVIVENIFGIPGLGRELISAFGQRDYPVAVGVTLTASVAFLVVNLLTDLAYGVLNPRIRTGFAEGSA